MPPRDIGQCLPMSDIFGCRDGLRESQACGQTSYNALSGPHRTESPSPKSIVLRLETAIDLHRPARDLVVGWVLDGGHWVRPQHDRIELQIYLRAVCKSHCPDLLGLSRLA